MRIQRISRGLPVEEGRGRLNRVIDRVNLNTDALGSAGVSVPGVAPDNILRVEIRILNADTLDCHLPGQALNPSAEVWTVKPPPTLTELMREAVNYVYADINTRTADGTEAQRLTPVYLLNDPLFIVPLDGEWYDLNIDGRQWAKLP